MTSEEDDGNGEECVGEGDLYLRDSYQITGITIQGTTIQKMF